MRRHDLDLVSLVAGILFAGIGLLYLVVSLTNATIDQRLVWPLVLVALGAGGVAAAVGANMRADARYAELEAEQAADLAPGHGSEQQGVS